MHLLFSHSVVSDFLRLHELHHTRLPCPSLSPGAQGISILGTNKSGSKTPRQLDWVQIQEPGGSFMWVRRRTQKKGALIRRRQTSTQSKVCQSKYQSIINPFHTTEFCQDTHVEGSHTWCNTVFSNITKEWKQIANIIYAANITEKGMLNNCRWKDIEFPTSAH